MRCMASLHSSRLHYWFSEALRSYSCAGTNVAVIVSVGRCAWAARVAPPRPRGRDEPVRDSLSPPMQSLSRAQPTRPAMGRARCAVAVCLLWQCVAVHAMMTSQTGSGLPVVMLHGVSSSHTEMDTIKKLAAARGIVATSLPIFEGKVDSLTPLKHQVLGMASALRKLIAANESLYGRGYHFICKSQGGLICRCVIEEMDDHKVHTFVSLAGPQMGVWGSAFFRSIGFPAWAQNLTADEVWRGIPAALQIPCLSLICGAIQSCEEFGGNHARNLQRAIW